MRTRIHTPRLNQNILLNNINDTADPAKDSKINYSQVWCYNNTLYKKLNVMTMIKVLNAL